MTKRCFIKEKNIPKNSTMESEPATVNENLTKITKKYNESNNSMLKKNSSKKISIQPSESMTSLLSLDSAVSMGSMASLLTLNSVQPIGSMESLLTLDAVQPMGSMTSLATQDSGLYLSGSSESLNNNAWQNNANQELVKRTKNLTIETTSKDDESKTTNKLANEIKGNKPIFRIG